MPSNSLEQEALDRVSRMYSSFDRRPHRPPRPPEPERPPQPEPQPEPETPPEEKPSGFLDILMRDKEQSLIMLLLIILMKDGADLNLILALIYLII